MSYTPLIFVVDDDPVTLELIEVSLQADGLVARTFDSVAQVLPALSPQEQLTFLRTRVESSLHGALSLALLRRGAPGVAEQSAAWLVNGKALSQQALAQPLLLARAGALPQLSARYGQLLDVRQRLAKLTLAVPQPDQEKQRRQQLDALAPPGLKQLPAKEESLTLARLQQTENELEALRSRVLQLKRRR